MNEDSETLVHYEIRGRKVVYYLATEDDLRNVKSNSLLGDACSGFAALVAGGVISTLLTRATGIQLAQQTANILDTLLYFFVLLTVVFVGFSVYFHRQSFMTIKRILTSGVVTSISGPDQKKLADVLTNEDQVTPTDSGLEIIKAEYWTDKARFDVAPELRQAIVNNRLEITASNAIKGDPDKGTKKRLTIEYRFAGVEVTKEFREGEMVSIP